MQDYKPLIVDDVQRSIGAMNDIVTTLQRDAPLTSDIMEINYPQNAVDSFVRSSQTVVDVSVRVIGHAMVCPAHVFPRISAPPPRKHLSGSRKRATSSRAIWRSRTAWKLPLGRRLRSSRRRTSRSPLPRTASTRSITRSATPTTTSRVPRSPCLMRREDWKDASASRGPCVSG